MDADMIPETEGFKVVVETVKGDVVDVMDPQARDTTTVARPAIAHNHAGRLGLEMRDLLKEAVKREPQVEVAKVLTKRGLVIYPEPVRLE